MSSEVLVVIGVGGMGRAIARRLGSGKAVLLADFSEDILHAAADALTVEGHNVTTHHVDASARESVSGLAKAAALGSVTQVAYTAGVPRHCRRLRRSLGWTWSGSPWCWRNSAT